MIIACVDIETTGLEPDAGVVELGWVEVHCEDGLCEWEGPKSNLFNPGIPIPPAASAVHHIVDADVVGKPKFRWGADSDYQALCAHNAKFEQQFIKSTLPWICTYKCAVTLAPKAPEFNLQTLRYWLKLDVERAIADQSHRAGPDALVCAALLARMLAKKTVEELVEISSKPVFLPYFTFGEHAMKPIGEVPTSYCDWIVNKSKGEWDEDVMHTAKTILYAAGARA